MPWAEKVHIRQRERRVMRDLEALGRAAGHEKGKDSSMPRRPVPCARSEQLAWVAESGR